MNTQTQTGSTRDKLAHLSSLDRQTFVLQLDGIFEHSPWIAEHSWAARPFIDIDSLHGAMLKVLDAASREDKLALIRAHPELAAKEAGTGTLTTASTGEQRGAGLDQCSREELDTLRRLNAEYRERHAFPFVIAVKGLNRYEIIDTLGTRIANDTETEFAACLCEIGRIARFRLDTLFAL